jgi:hypothetical protein
MMKEFTFGRSRKDKEMPLNMQQLCYEEINENISESVQNTRSRNGSKLSREDDITRK